MERSAGGRRLHRPRLRHHLLQPFSRRREGTRWRREEEADTQGAIIIYLNKEKNNITASIFPDCICLRDYSFVFPLLFQPLGKRGRRGDDTQGAAMQRRPSTEAKRRRRALARRRHHAGNRGATSDTEPTNILPAADFATPTRRLATPSSPTCCPPSTSSHRRLEGDGFATPTPRS